jgi:formate hydrogenlyase subunit 3/multisubunit Na+/H+ antiporter MnhD subunit
MAEVLREGVVAAQMGQWAAPFGITLVADLLSAVMVVITGITGLAVAIYALADVDERKEALGYHAFTRCCWPASAARSSPGTCSTSMSGSRSC